MGRTAKPAQRRHRLSARVLKSLHAAVRRRWPIIAAVLVASLWSFAATAGAGAPVNEQPPSIQGAVAMAATSSVTGPATEGSTTTLQTSPSAVVADQPVTVIATVTSTDASSSPSGSVVLRSNGGEIRGCGTLAVNPTGQSVTVSCQTAFTAGPFTLTASFSPSTGSEVGPSASSAIALNVGSAPSITTLTTPPEVDFDTRSTYTAMVAPTARSVDVATPTGRVSFREAGKTISGCASRILVAQRATCTVTYPALGAHRITAAYGGDANFAPSTSPTVRVTVRPIPPTGFVDSYVSWTFLYTPTHTTVAALTVSGLSTGTSVTVACKGRGCPFALDRAALPGGQPCVSSGAGGCPAPGMIDLTSIFRQQALSVGTQLAVFVTHADWLGKYYQFTIRSAQEPQIAESCLAVDMSQPGIACSIG